MGLKKILAGCVAVAALLGVSGCSQSGSVAATVNGTVITEDYVQGSASAIDAILSQDPAYANYDFVGFVLGNSIMEDILTVSLGQMGITLSDQERESVWTSSYDPSTAEYSLWTDPDTQQAITGLIDLTIVNSRAQSGSIDTDRLLTLIDAMSVTLNPRYGQWDPSNLAISSRVTRAPAGSLADPLLFTIPA